MSLPAVSHPANPDAGAALPPSREAVEAVTQALAARFGNRLVTSLAVRQQHGHTLTWIPNQAPDALPTATRQHRAIYEALASRDAPAAEAAMRIHLEVTLKAIAELDLDFVDRA